MKKFKLSLLVVAVAIAVTGAFAFNVPAKDGKAFTAYHYTGGSSFTDMQDPDFWEGVAPAEGCGSTGNIPCTVNTSDPIGTYLQTFNNASEFLEVATKRE
jgi:hypothetical protein